MSGPSPAPALSALFPLMGGGTPVWAHNGGEIVYVSPDDSWVVATVRTDPNFAVESRALFAAGTGFRAWANARNFDISPDDQRLLGLDVVHATVRDVVILNFFEELKVRVPN